MENKKIKSTEFENMNILEKRVYEQGKKIKIDIVVPPYSGHLNPILSLIKPFILNKNYDICIHTGGQKKDFIEKLGIKCDVILPNKPTVFEDIANTSKKTNVFVSYNQFKENIKLIPEFITDLEDRFKRRNPDVIIVDFIAIPAGIISDKMGIPWISSMPTPFIIESKTTTPSYMGGWYPKENIFYKIRDMIGRKVVRIFKRVVCHLATKYVRELNYKLYNENNEENAYSSHSILALGMKELEFRDDFPNKVIWAGPCLSDFSDKKNEFIANLQYKNKILVTIGTHLLWGKEELIELAKELGLVFEGTVFIVSLGNFSQKNEPVEKISDNVYVYKYVDYSEILPVVDYVIHHGGAGILYDCIKYNKPAVIIPHDYDQFDYAVRADLAGIGIPANLKSKKSIEIAVRKMINKKEWNKLDKIHKKLYDYHPSEVLRSEIERLVLERK